ncbi:MAG: diguanylate cyclase domain-containing protein [Candidatus Adiutrix sp.]
MKYNSCHIACLEPESGLYHLGHLKSMLAHELVRQDRCGRPLVLAVLASSGLGKKSWELLGPLLSASLRRLDLAARLGLNEIAIIFPEADRTMAMGRIDDLMGKIKNHPTLKAIQFSYGLAVSKPWGDASCDDILSMALDDLEREKPQNGDKCICHLKSFKATAIAADERNLLFDGFKSLEIHHKH